MAITLEKGQRISLEKQAGIALSKVFLGLGWGKRKTRSFLGFGKGEEAVDLDASCLLFDENGTLTDQIWFRQLRSHCNTVHHSGDDRSGGGDASADNERIQIDLVALPTHIKTLIFTVNSFTGESFEGIPSAFCRLVDVHNNRAIARFNLSLDGGGHTGLIMAKLYRHGSEWKMHAIGEHGTGRTFEALLPAIQPYL